MAKGEGGDRDDGWIAFTNSMNMSLINLGDTEGQGSPATVQGDAESRTHNLETGTTTKS